MAFKLANRAVQTSTTSGLGTLSLIAPATGVASFVAQVGDGNTTGYLIDDPNGDWEITIGQVAAGSPDTITRAATPIASSTGARVNFGGGAKTIAVIPIAELIPYMAAVPSYADDQILQRKSGAWTPRTVAQLLVDLTANGIPFPATPNPQSDPNTLDDYAEATWTPNLLIGGASTGITYARRNGLAIKIGGIVILLYEILLSSKGSLTGAVSVSGLPYTALNIGGFANADGLGLTNGSGVPAATAMVMSVGTATANLTSVGVGQLSNADLNNTSFTAGMTIYRAA